MLRILHVLPVVIVMAACSQAGNSAAKRIEAALIPATKPMPQTLADTNLFANPSELILQREVLHYDVNVPLWSDGAKKDRFVFVPPETTIAWDETTQDFSFPIGTVLIKHFAADASRASFIETRVIVLKDDGEWHYATYLWQEDGSAIRSDDATTVNGAQTGQQDYRIPSNDECHSCHDSRGVLGFRPRQLNKRDGQEDQLTTLQSARGFALFAQDPARLRATAALPAISDQFSSLDTRARAYLDVNCSSCHRPDGVGSFLDLRMATPFAETHITELGVLNPGHHETSVLWKRMAETGSGMRMPPISLRPDPQGLALIGQWIDDMPAVPAP